MNREIRDKWIDELESDKHVQCKGYLRKDNSYCCLGILYEKVLGHKPDLGLSGRHHYRYGWEDDHGYIDTGLPPSTLKEIELSPNDQDQLQIMNDTGSSFHKIADWIRKHL